MSKRRTHHIRLHYVLPPEQRNEYQALPEEAKASWKNALLDDEQIDEPGDTGNYFLDLTPQEAALANSPAIKNVEYAIPAEDVHAHGNPDATELVAEAGSFDLRTEDVEGADARTTSVSGKDFAFPEAKAMAYHRANGTEKNRSAGKGYLIWHLDDGVSKALEDMTPGGIVFRKNYVQGGSDTTIDGRHGSMTFSLAVPMGAAAAICKVLHNGSGSSVGITAAIRDAARFVRENPKYKNKVVLSGSLGGSPGVRFKPYEDACREAEAAGVLCRWSAGNDGAPEISPPSNWKEYRASIAFDLGPDRRAGFSNHHATAGLSAQGQSVLMIDRNGNLVRGNGTSFSLPFENRHIIVAAWMRSASVFGMYAAVLANARNSEEPTTEESSGVINVWKAINKYMRPGEEPSDDKLFAKFQEG